MNSSKSLTYIALILLTISAAILSRANYTLIGVFILLLSALKFIAVGFEFMELKTAHAFWKISFLSFIVIVFGIITIILMN